VVKVYTNGPTGNRLLNLLPEAELRSLQERLRPVALTVKQVVYEMGGPMDYVYFPTDCVLSAVTVMGDGSTIEVGTVGNEGLSGLPSLAAVESSLHRVFAQIPGDALRIEAKPFHKECVRLPGLGQLMVKYQQAFLFQVSQSVACNGLHVIVERCCRWLLMTHDRVSGDDITLTHEFLSFMLGVRRSSVTEVLQNLQQQRLISYRQGNITVVDRPGLEDLACECYQRVRTEYDRLLA
jgi:CRP-like cAMP-binding protein